jgi:hypothetical protein
LLSLTPIRIPARWLGSARDSIVTEEHTMTRDQQSEHIQGEETGKVERFRVLVGSRLAELGAPSALPAKVAQTEDTDDDVNGHAWSVKQD